MQAMWRGEITNVRLVLPPPTALRAVDHYLARAAYCVEIAEGTTDSDVQLLFLAAARCFEQVAEEAEIVDGGALLN
jgi:hypothetical protein